MSEVKTITLHDGRLITVEELPEEYKDWPFRSVKSVVNSIPGNIFLGRLSEITEEQIVEHNLVQSGFFEHGFCEQKEGYYDYEMEYFTDVTAKESLLSLLKVNGIDTTKEWVLILKK